MKEWELKSRFITDNDGILEDDFLKDVVLVMSNFIRGRISVDDFSYKWKKYYTLLTGEWVRHNRSQAEEWMKENKVE